MIDESDRDRERKGRARREKRREIVCMWERELDTGAKEGKKR